MIYYKHPLNVYYRDVDKMGIVYYSRYFEYFEEARTNLLRTIGLNITSIEKKGIYLPVILAHCEYKKGLELDQSVILDTSILELPKSKLKINYIIKSENNLDFYVKGYTEHAFMKKNGKPTRVPNLLLNIIKKYLDK